MSDNMPPFPLLWPLPDEDEEEEEPKAEDEEERPKIDLGPYAKPVFRMNPAYKKPKLKPRK